MQTRPDNCSLFPRVPRLSQKTLQHCAGLKNVRQVFHDDDHDDDDDLIIIIMIYTHHHHLSPSTRPTWDQALALLQGQVFGKLQGEVVVSDDDYDYVHGDGEWGCRHL